MAPHFSKHELDTACCMTQRGSMPTEIHRHFTRLRTKSGVAAPDLTTVRRALRGVTHKRSMKETRGPKAKLTPVQVRRLNAVRKELIRKAAGEGEVHIADVMAKAKINHVSISTVSKHFKMIGVSWKTPREAPLRMKVDEEERVRICSRWKRLPNDYFTDKVDGMWDNKKFDVALHPCGKRYLKMKKVRGHLRTRAEGVARHFTKPKSNKNKVNPGASVNVCAALISSRVRVWEYLPERWCGHFGACRRPAVLHVLRARWQAGQGFWRPRGWKPLFLY